MSTHSFITGNPFPLPKSENRPDQAFSELLFVVRASRVGTEPHILTGMSNYYNTSSSAVARGISSSPVEVVAGLSLVITSSLRSQTCLRRSLAWIKLQTKLNGMLNHPERLSRNSALDEYIGRQTVTKWLPKLQSMHSGSCLTNRTLRLLQFVKGGTILQ